jgi:cytochrome P450
MDKLALLLTIVGFASGCAPANVSQQEIQEVARTLNYGNYTSSTLATKGWDALAERDYPATLAYTQKCVELYGEQGKAMNAELDNFAPIERVNNYWALNDAGTCTYIMATVYETLRMYPEAAHAYRSLADDYTYSQCWDPNGWYWHPASGAAAKADKYAAK